MPTMHYHFAMMMEATTGGVKGNKGTHHSGNQSSVGKGIKEGANLSVTSAKKMDTSHAIAPTPKGTHWAPGSQQERSMKEKVRHVRGHA